MADRLPDYEHHPLDETVMGVQFQPLQGFGLQSLFRFWSLIRDRYPRIEEQSPLVHYVEAASIKPQNQALLSLSPQLPTPRRWFVDESGNEVIQVQVDQFLRNWRLVRGDEKYPRFSYLATCFWREWELFQAFLAEEKIGVPKVDQCNLTYVNYIDPNQIQGGLSAPAEMFSVFREQKGFLPGPEVFKWESSYPLPEGHGRLHVVAAPNFRQRDLKLVINLTLIARGNPPEVSNESIKAWFEVAHEWVVRGFDELTTPTMHKLWGKKT